MKKPWRVLYKCKSVWLWMELQSPVEIVCVWPSTPPPPLPDLLSLSLFGCFDCSYILLFHEQLNIGATVHYNLVHVLYIFCINISIQKFDSNYFFVFVFVWSYRYKHKIQSTGIAFEAGSLFQVNNNLGERRCPLSSPLLVTSQPAPVPWFDSSSFPPGIKLYYYRPSVHCHARISLLIAGRNYNVMFEIKSKRRHLGHFWETLSIFMQLLI